MIASPAQVNCHRNGNLIDATIKAQTADKLNNLCDEYTDIFSKHWYWQNKPNTKNHYTKRQQEDFR